MDATIVEKINKSGKKIFAAITGGGQTFIGDYLKCGGASNTIVGAIVPYSTEFFDSFAGCKPNKYASIEAARKLALASFNEAIKYGAKPEEAIGVGSANSIVKKDERTGRQHSINIAIHSLNTTRAFWVELEQGRTREEEENIISNIILGMLNWTVYNKRYFINLRESAHFSETIFNKCGDIITGKIPFFERYKTNTKSRLVYSGSFNPFHAGHLAVYETAKKITKRNIALEISLTNTDKPALDYIDLYDRLNIISQKNLPFIITNAQKYIHKAKILSEDWIKPVTFIVGTDTWNRLWDTKYYNNWKEMDIMGRTFWENNIRFMVFPRPGYEINHIWDDLRIYKEEIKKEYKPIDISSTQLRKEQNESKGN